MTQFPNGGNDRAFMFEKLSGVRADPYKIDEGYSEGTRSQEGLDSPMRLDGNEDSSLDTRLPPGLSLQDAVLGLSEAERKEFAYNILRSLRASIISSVVDQLWPLFHKDPIAHFPAEIIFQIFAYLDPRTLIESSKVSKAWRTRALDGRIWRDKFKVEGWGLDSDEIGKHERSYNFRGLAGRGTSAQKAQARKLESRSRSQKKLKQKSRLPQNRGLRSIFSGSAQDGASEQDDDSVLNVNRDLSVDEDMPDIGESLSHEGFKGQQSGPIALKHREPQDDSDSDSSDPRSGGTIDEDSSRSPEPHIDQSHLQELSLMTPNTSGYSNLNYHYIFKQKRKLEENWNAGRYKSFQLPHRDHPEDAHTECVYTIQYLGKYLVSGSRDRTLRIWDLDTQRLARAPLQGHSGSVLCLQFDDSKEEDIIISGSSDTHVILWRFSTGQTIHRLTKAHRESVLNLRFDKRFLVTCSKDKTIKIWSRHQLKPGDPDYPIKGVSRGGQCPSYIIDYTAIPVALRFGPSRPEHAMLLEPYTHLMTLDLHGAAVNAIQIYEDQLVSASGDRNLRVWNIHTGECTTKIEAHSKGIACVQYDGKRIVSGSSDATIRIWDPISHVEVARLEGHSRLVRTIQAAFADVPGGREGLEAEAAEVDRQWKIARDAGELSQPSRRGPQPPPGSRRPNDLRGINAKIPPSGGGGRWSHIVSGSYDETIIVWKKTEDDEWVVGLRLRQEDALTAAGPELPSRPEPGQQDNPVDQLPPLPPHGLQNTPIAQQIINQAAANARAAHQAMLLTSQGVGSSSHASQGSAGPSIPSHHQPALNPQMQGPPAPPGQAHAQAQTQGSNAAAPPRPNHPPHPHPHPNPHHHLYHQGPHQQAQTGGPGGPNAIINANANNHPNNNNGNGNGNGGGGQPNARVFKLQFDARRIICCSQDPKIVGWDFANGDEEIMECSRFFAAPQ